MSVFLRCTIYIVYWLWCFSWLIQKRKQIKEATRILDW